MERFQAIDQPATVGSQQRCHVRNGADAEQIPGSLNRFGLVETFSERMGQNKRQTNPSKTSIGGGVRGRLGMNQRPHRATLRRNRMVIRDDDLKTEGLRTMEGFIRRYAVVNGDENADALAMEGVHHAPVQAIAVLHPRWNGRNRIGTQRA